MFLLTINISWSVGSVSIHLLVGWSVQTISLLFSCGWLDWFQSISWLVRSVSIHLLVGWICFNSSHYSFLLSIGQICFNLSLGWLELFQSTSWSLLLQSISWSAGSVSICLLVSQICHRTTNDTAIVSWHCLVYWGGSRMTSNTGNKTSFFKNIEQYHTHTYTWENTFYVSVRRRRELRWKCGIVAASCKKEICYIKKVNSQEYFYKLGHAPFLMYLHFEPLAAVKTNDERSRWKTNGCNKLTAMQHLAKHLVVKHINASPFKVCIYLIVKHKNTSIVQCKNVFA